MIYSNLQYDSTLCSEPSAPKLIQIIYTLTKSGLKIDLSWFEKDANRLTEAIFYALVSIGKGKILELDIFSEF